MSLDPLSQTSFSQETPQPLVDPTIEPPVKKNPILPIVVILVVLVAVVLFVLFWLSRGSSVPQINPTAVPLSSANPVQTDQIRRDIESDLQTIEAANPEADEHPFPPIDFTIRIKDPSAP